MDPDQQKMDGSGSAKNGWIRISKKWMDPAQPKNGWIRTTRESLTNGRRQEGSPQPFNVNFYYNPLVTFYDDDMSPFLPRIEILIFCYQHLLHRISFRAMDLSLS
jgi:hypothetical protein